MLIRLSRRITAFRFIMLGIVMVSLILLIRNLMLRILCLLRVVSSLLFLLLSLVDPLRLRYGPPLLPSGLRSLARILFVAKLIRSVLFLSFSFGILLC